MVLEVARAVSLPVYTFLMSINLTFEHCSCPARVFAKGRSDLIVMVMRKEPSTLFFPFSYVKTEKTKE